MNYYRRFVGSYLKKTTKITMIEDGAYTRLLDTYYADEKPLIPTEIYKIARAMKAAERRAVDSVVAKYFFLGNDGLLHNEKADEELGVAIPKLEKLREVARANGAKGGRPPKEPDRVVDKNPDRLSVETESGSSEKPNPVPENNPAYNQPSTVSHQPEAKPKTHRFPGDSNTSTQSPPPTAEGRDQPQPHGALARILLECQRSKVEDPTQDNPVIKRWISQGATPTQVAKALTEARAPGSKPFPDELRAGYVDPILDRIRTQDAAVTAANAARINRTQQLIDDQATWTTSPMPEHLRPKRRSTSPDDPPHGPIETLDS